MISTNVDLIFESNRKDQHLPLNYTKNYYGTALKDKLKLNEDFTAISEELFIYLSEKHKCLRPIIRYDFYLFHLVFSLN